MKLSKRFRDNFGTLKKLKSIKDPKKLQQILKTADKKLIGTLIEITANILHKRIPLKPYQVKKLSNFKKDIVKLGKTRSYSQGRKILVQKGGSFLPLLLGPIISAASGLIADLISK